jgi:diadenosine tetraphosphate (Ap4A) HIT family hydrolase
LHKFSLHAQLASDCHLLGNLGLSQALLLDDSRYPWVILVPRRAGVREIFELAAGDRHNLLEESCRTGEFMMQAFAGEKLNVAALGNLVPQLHLHHVIRKKDDPAWPGPVWGHSTAVPYPQQLLDERMRILRDGLSIAA